MICGCMSASWALLSAELPNHAEASVLLRDPHAPATVYAAFSRLGPEQIKSMSAPPDAAFARSDIALLVGAYGGFALLLLGVGMIARRFARAGAARAAVRSTEATQ